MIVLGLNGWLDRTHDPAATIVADGRVVAFVEQERLSRDKHGIGQLPRDAVATVLRQAAAVDIRPRDIDRVSYGWDLQKFNRLRGRSIDLTDATARLTGLDALRHIPLEQVRHHEAHAASAFYGTGLSEATVIVVDAEGENESTTIFHATADGLREVRSFPRGTSLGLMYRAVSVFCGFGLFGAGKTMGLAPWHEGPVRSLPLTWEGGEIASSIPPAAWEDEVVEHWLSYLQRNFGAPGTTAALDVHGFPPRQAHHPEVAAAAQLALNQVMIGLVTEAIQLTGCTDVCLAGGVALNCVSNGLLLDEVPTLRSLHIPPYPHDAGVALGSAQMLLARSGRPWNDTVRAATGPSPDEFEAERAAHERSLPVERPQNVAAEAAELLALGKLIAWVEGPMEVGPRALGHRSILTLGADAEVRERVNALKGREPWRPLAPSVLEEDTHALLGRELSSPFMLLSVPLSDLGLRVAPAAAHVDGSSRVQTVPLPRPGILNAENAEYRRVLEQVRTATGHSILLNTSLNTRGEPLAHTAGEALIAALRIGLDALIVNDVLIRLPGASPAPACPDVAP